MKVAIQGHPFRGKEVIQILEQLGGKNVEKLSGTFKSFYYIDSENEITDEHEENFSSSYKLYTLEEFEKEFPFKVGDKVVWDKDNYTAVRTVLRIDYSDLTGIKYAITAFGAANCFWEVDVNELKSYKEMKEERNITLTLDKAKEWYKKGGELREIALQTFTEKELTKTDLPKTWEEFCENYPVQSGECWLGSCDEIYKKTYDKERIYKNWIPSRKSAEAHLAMIQLEQLRNCWRQGWVQTPTDTGYRICKLLTGGYTILSVGTLKYFLAFPTEKMAREFLECFRDLIEQAGDLI